jgi:hypothetical protein
MCSEPTFFNYATADELYNLVLRDKTGINNVMKAKKPDFQLRFSFGGERVVKIRSQEISVK